MEMERRALQVQNTGNCTSESRGRAVGWCGLLHGELGFAGSGSVHVAELEIMLWSYPGSGLESPHLPVKKLGFAWVGNAGPWRFSQWTINTISAKRGKIHL